MELARGMDAKARNKNGWVALMAAANFNQNSAIITILLTAGADIGVKNSAGDTAYSSNIGKRCLKRQQSALAITRFTINK